MKIYNSKRGCLNFNHFLASLLYYADIIEVDNIKNSTIFNLYLDHTQEDIIPSLGNEHLWTTCMFDRGVSPLIVNKFNKILNNAECILTHTITDEIPENIKNKCVLLPKFTINHTNLSNIQKTENLVYFRGSLTNKIRKDVYNHIQKSNDTIFDVSLFLNDSQSQIHKIDSNTFNNSPLPYLKYRKTLAKYVSSLCLPGHSPLTYRHIESFHSECNVLSFSPYFSNEYFLFRNLLHDSYIHLDYSLNDLIDKAQYSLIPSKENIERIRYNKDLYTNFWELEPNNVYKRHIWRHVSNQLQSIGVPIDNKKIPYK